MTRGEEIFETSSPKLLFWGFMMVIILVVALAVIGWPIREIDEPNHLILEAEQWQNGLRF